MRTSKPISSELCHRAAINFVAFTENGMIVTGSADKTIKAFELGNLKKPAVTMNATDAIFCGETLGSLVVTGCGDGNILVFDLN